MLFKAFFGIGCGFGYYPLIIVAECLFACFGVIFITNRAMECCVAVFGAGRLCNNACACRGMTLSRNFFTLGDYGSAVFADYIACVSGLCAGCVFSVFASISRCMITCCRYDIGLKVFTANCANID